MFVDDKTIDSFGKGGSCALYFFAEESEVQVPYALAETYAQLAPYLFG